MASLEIDRFDHKTPKPMMKIILAEKNIPGMTKQEIERFLGTGQLILRLGTMDVDDGGPAIHPVWYHYENDHLYFFSGEKARKVQNVRKNSRVYFSVDTESRPNKGVRGKGKARFVTESNKGIQVAEKIVRRYMSESSPGYKDMMGYAKSGKALVIEILPEYYTVWDYSKIPMM